MNMISSELRATNASITRGIMNVETFAKNPLLSSNGKWGIRFNTNGLATVIVGMKYFGYAHMSVYFAQLVAARLGVPFCRIRVYCSATLPAVSQTPRPHPNSLLGSNF